MASTTFEVYAETAPAPRMRAIAKIALARGVSQTSAAAKLGLHSSNVRRHFESKAVRSSTVDAYIELLARNELDRNLMREYLDILDGRFDVQSAREAVINDLRARELNLREGALSDLLAAIEAIADTTLLPALQAYLQTNREWRLSLVASPFMLSFVGRKLGLAFEVFAGAINEHVDVEAFLSPERTPAEDCLWLLWAHTHIPDSPFTDDDREAIIDLAAGRLLRRGIDAVPMLRYVDRLREHTARKVALTEASIAQSKASSTKGGRLSERQTTAAKGTQER
jgi:AcrR family transcriptional regulator